MARKSNINLEAEEKALMDLDQKIKELQKKKDEVKKQKEEKEKKTKELIFSELDFSLPQMINFRDALENNVEFKKYFYEIVNVPVKKEREETNAEKNVEKGNAVKTKLILD